jgi:8-oxo-dGTP pyrophosphatase MutT (NUDIX family)
MTEEWVMRAAMAERARRFAAEGGTPATPRVAATVVLLRSLKPHQLEVYLVRRAATMAFASGMYAFPGGSVEPSDPGVAEAAVREVLEETGVLLTVDGLVPWSRWITPEFEPRRFDAYLFLAALPPGQQARTIGGEADHAVWLPPAEALVLPLLPPTSRTLRELVGYSRVDAALEAAAGRDAATPVRSRVVADRLVYQVSQVS